MSQGSDLARIQVGIADQVIHTSMKTPGPGGDGAAIGGIVVARAGAGLLRQPGIEPFADLLPVRIDVAVVESGQGVTALDDSFQRPICGLSSSPCFGGGMIGYPF